jgi:hypothetical protein
MQDGWEQTKHKKRKGKKSELARMTEKARFAAKVLKRHSGAESSLSFIQRFMDTMRGDIQKAKRFVEGLEKPVDKKELKLYTELMELTRDVKLKKGGK